MTCHRIITRVEYAYPSELEGMKPMGRKLVTIPENVEWRRLAVKVPASLTISNKEDNKNNIFTASLKFNTFETLDVSRRHVFRVTLVGGKQMLIGTSTRPFTMIELTENMPERVTSTQHNEVVVTYKSNHDVPYII